MSKMTDREALRAEVNDAVISMVRGGLRVVGGTVQVVAGVTRLLIDTAIAVVEAAEEAVAATGVDEEDPKEKPKSQ